MGRLEKLEEALSEEKSNYDVLRGKWECEKKSLESEKEIKEKIDQVRYHIEDAQRRYDLETLSKLKY